MTAFDQASKSPLLVEATEQTEAASVLASANFRRGSLPKPKGTSAKVADTGRIRFGAAFRLPTSK